MLIAADCAPWWKARTTVIISSKESSWHVGRQFFPNFEIDWENFFLKHVEKKISIILQLLTLKVILKFD